MNKKVSLTTKNSEYSDSGLNGDVKGLINEGMELLNQKKLDEAKGNFDKALSIDPSNSEAMTWLAITLGKKLDAANMINKMRLLPKFEKAVKGALLLDPDSPMVRRINGIRLLKIPVEFGGSLEKSIEEFLYCISRGMKDTEIYQLLGQAY